MQHSRLVARATRLAAPSVTGAEISSVFLSKTKIIKATIHALVGLKIKIYVIFVDYFHCVKIVIHSQTWLQEFESSRSPNTPNETLQNFYETSTIAF
jgi:Na+(H+)/acetate symporter ActP